MKCTVLKKFNQAIDCRTQVTHKVGVELDFDEKTVKSLADQGLVSFDGQMVEEVAALDEDQDDEPEWMCLNKADLDAYAESEYGIKLKRSMSLENMQAAFSDELAKKESE